MVYFGKRYLNTQLQRWVSADPLEIHSAGEADANLYAYVSGQALKNIDPLGLREQSQDQKDRKTAEYQQGQVDGRIVTEAAIQLEHDRGAAEGWREDRLDTLKRAIHDPDLRAEKKAAIDAEFNKRIEDATNRYDEAVESVMARQHAMPQESTRETHLYQKGLEAGARGAIIDDAISREVGKMVLTTLATAGIGGAFRLAAGIRSAVLARSALNGTSRAAGIAEGTGAIGPNAGVAAEGRTFYSGGKAARETAERIASRHGGSTLKLPPGTPSDKVLAESLEYAHGARGPVHAVVGPKQGPVWPHERAALQQNSNVTSITIHLPVIQ